MMTRLMLVALLAVAAMLMASNTSSALAAAGKVPVPFKGTLAGSETDVFDLATTPPTMYVDGSMSGNATHLGRYTATYKAAVDFTGCGCSNGDTIHLVAANGDTINAVGHGVGIPYGPPADNVFSITQVYTITGGTGRFAGATGDFTVQRLGSPITGVTSGTFNGTIVIAHGE